MQIVCLSEDIESHAGVQCYKFIKVTAVRAYPFHKHLQPFLLCLYHRHVERCKELLRSDGELLYSAIFYHKNICLAGGGNLVIAIFRAVESYIFVIKDSGIEQFTIRPEQFFAPFDMPVVKTQEEGLEMFMKGISPDGGDFNKLIALNSGVALYVFGQTDDLHKGYEKALEAIQSGKVLEKYRSL